MLNTLGDWKTEQRERIAEEIKKTPGLYKSCLFCSDDLLVDVRRIKHTYKGSCSYDSDSEQWEPEGFVNAPEILTVSIEAQYSDELDAQLREKKEHYERLAPRLLARASARREREFESHLENLASSLDKKSANTAATALADESYKKYEPKTVQTIGHFYDIVRKTLAFESLARESQELPGELRRMHPDGLKMHMKCAEDRLPLSIHMYRSLAMEGKCMLEFPALVLAHLLSESPTANSHTRQLITHDALLSDRSVLLTLGKYDATGHSS